MEKKLGVKLNKLGIYTIEDLLTYYPSRYNFNIITPLDANLDKIFVEAIVETIPIVSYYSRVNRLTFNARVYDNIVKVVVFNKGFLKNHLEVGSKVMLEGKYSNEHNSITVSNITISNYVSLDEISSVYKKSKDITNNYIQTQISKYLDSEVSDYVPEEYRVKYDFLSKSDSLRMIHKPSSVSDIKVAKIRLKYEELFMYMFKINCLKYNNKQVLGSSKVIDFKLVEDFIASLDYRLTKDQLGAINDVYEEMISNRRMNRMIQGDVGSGKTIVGIVSIFMNTLSKYQSAFMAPTEILANQHYNNISKLFEKYNIRVCLLTGAIKDKKDIYTKIKSGYYQVVVGTHSLINDALEFNNLGLIITDEQQRFGVNQRYLLKEKSSHCDCIYMSATPIPRSYALILYKDMSLSLIKTKPSSRIDVITKVIEEKNVVDALEIMYKELKLSHQVYVVAKAINDSTDDSQSVLSLKENLNSAFGKKYKIDILHGKMSTLEKDEVMARFKDKEVDILISTTVIEVGVDVANASVMVVFDANYFGLSQLHQLRGRVGRSDIESYCLLISKEVNNERLKILENNTDGFKISEEDFHLRGVGDLFGVKQSGEANFKIVDLKTDIKILNQANDDSMKFLKKVINNIDEYELYKTIVYDSINLD